MGIKKWFRSFSKKRNFIPTEEATKMLALAEDSFQDAKQAYKTSKRIGTILRLENERNHYKERLELAWVGKEK